MGDIEETLAKRLNQLGIRRQVDAAGVVEAAEKEIAKILPREDFGVVSFKEGILKVYVASSVVANELELYKARISREMQKAGINITKIRAVLCKNGQIKPDENY